MEPISFARGVPAPECLPVEELADCARAALVQDGRAVLSYGPGGGYGPLYQLSYMMGGLQLWALRKELVDSGKMTELQFHDAILRENRIPIAMVRASLTKQKLSRDYAGDWKFYGPNPTLSKRSEVP